MEKYRSKEVVMPRPASEIYSKLSRLDALTPFVADKAEGWQATEDTCSFRAKGFPVSIRVAERIENRLVKVVPEGQTPFDFAFQVELREETPGQTAMSFGLDIALNPMMKMMVGGQLQKGLDTIAETLSEKLKE